MEQTTGIPIQHALNEGEKQVGLKGHTYHLDGYSRDPDTQQEVAWEYLGCYYHACPQCFGSKGQEDEVNDKDQIMEADPRTQLSSFQRYKLTQKRRAELQQAGFKVIEIWEHEFQQQKKDNPTLNQFCQSQTVVERLDPREAFFGGRTNAACLHYQTQGEEKIHYQDVTSLYPTVLKYDEFPVGHPQVITKDFKPITECFGFAKVKVLPPRGLYHPVLPYRTGDKLMFPLCAKCAENQNQNPCTCTPEQRCMTGTWVTPELHKAVELGYQIVTIYEVYHFEKTTQFDCSTGQGGLFADYVNTFLKYKQESSGWPDWCVTEEQKQQYIAEYRAKEGIQLDYDNISVNKGMRQLAKLCLNCFWGKFGQAEQIPHTTILRETSDFYNMLFSRSKKLSDFHVLNENTIMVEWKHTEESIPINAAVNVFVAAYTTAHARLRLYRIMEPLGERVLYYDTDSVIYRSSPGDWNHPCGDQLGELTDELTCDGVGCSGCDKPHFIQTFVSGGPKNYAYQLNSGQTECKVRGFTLNHANSAVLNFDAIKQLVLEGEEEDHIDLVNPNKITRDKYTQQIVNKKEVKRYKKVYTKRRILPDLTTLPYGY